MTTNTRYDNFQFQNLPLTGAHFDLTFEQYAGVVSHRINAIHTNEETGAVTRFLVEIIDDKRRKEFAEGLGDFIQTIFRARCETVFARRNSGVTTPVAPEWPGDDGDSGTPNRHLAAVRIAGMGVWQKGADNKNVFVLAKWAYKNADGIVVQGGALPFEYDVNDAIAQSALATKH